MTDTLVTPWTPDLAETGRPAYARIVEALAADIEAGALARGARLPTQRALADRLGVALGTVTRAYAEAEARGLIDATVGRGSFVAGAAAAAPRREGPIDLARNLPPMGPARRALTASMAQLVRRSDLVERLDYPPDGGFEADRNAGARWLRATSHYPSADPGRLICTAGAQQGIAVAISATTRPGETLIVEEATFHGAKLAATRCGLAIAAAAMDAEGLRPDALDKAAAETGARVAYVLPFQNPTARVMSLARRQEIIAVARRRRMILIEDDLYGAHITDLGLPPLAELAPDCVTYISGLSKSLAPGLRTGYLAPPPRLVSAAQDALRAIAFGPPALGDLVAVQWIESGLAFDIYRDVCAELETRTGIARRLLGAAMEPVARRRTPHVWLPMGELEAERLAGRALRAGVQVTSPRAPFVAGTPVTGVRVCLGAADSAAALEPALAVVADALSAGAFDEAVV
ncbi:MAG TPA: PLP-dependent aminotransferase family protein [Caulobacteraceae bacterium]|jgi:DNA-binding transcriptional MocR family regulator